MNINTPSPKVMDQANMIWNDNQKKIQKATSDVLKYQRDEILKATQFAQDHINELVQAQADATKAIFGSLSTDMLSALTATASLINTQWQTSLLPPSTFFQQTAFENDKWFSKWDTANRRAIQISNKYNWIITYNMDSSLTYQLAKAEGENQVSNIYKEYFIKDNFEYLDYHLNQWLKSKVFNNRTTILSDCVSIFKEKHNATSLNINNIIIPTLINQIEGLKCELQNAECIIKAVETLSKTEKKRAIELLFQNADEYIQYPLRLLFKLIYADDSKEERVSFSLNRHGISHGTNFSYGTIDNTIRCFLVIDFLHSVMENEYEELEKVIRG